MATYADEVNFLKKRKVKFPRWGEDEWQGWSAALTARLSLNLMVWTHDELEKERVL